MNLNTCWITLNRVCNLRCFFCYAKNTEYASSSTMTFENVKAVIDFCKEGNIGHIILIGGEPTVYRELFDVIKYAAENGITSSLVTNGVMLSNIEYCKKLLENGVTNIDISVKGNNIQDFIRVTEFDKFDLVMSAIENLSKLNAEFSCSMVITQENVKTFCEGVENAFKHGAKFVGLSFAYDFCMEEEKDKGYLLKNNPYQLISDFVSQIETLEKITNGNWSLECGFPLCLYTEEQLNKLSPHLVTSCQLLENGGIIFDGELNIIPCNTMFPIKLGRLGKDFHSFAEFLEYSKTGIYRESIDYLRSVPSEKCLECEKLEYCGGGCVNFWTHCSFDELEVRKDFLQKIMNKNLDKLSYEAKNFIQFYFENPDIKKEIRVKSDNYILDPEELKHINNLKTILEELEINNIICSYNCRKLDENTVLFVFDF